MPEPPVDIGALRREYRARALSPADVAPDPLAQFRAWFAEAHTAGVLEPNAMVLATAGDDGAPSARTVLLKAVDEDGFVFFTRYTSRKGRELAVNPRAALLFPWLALERQVSVRGSAERVAPATSDAYFATRPRGAQLAAWASPQSEPLADRAWVEARVADAAERFAGAAVPRPDEWGGVRVRPVEVEFWQGRADRLHDRVRYRRADGGWVVERLAP